jgi:hypothetical protein
MSADEDVSVDEDFSADFYILPAQQVSNAFTALDRAGGSTERLFGQNETWIDKNKVEHRLDEMPLSYLCAVQKHIENRAAGYRFAIGNAVALSLVMFDASDDVADEVFASLDEDEGRPDAEWLADQPLYRRISGLLGDRRFEDAPHEDAQRPDEGSP